jgi:MoxR-like ATPase
MNDKPVLDADGQTQPASPESRAQAALATITSVARRVREALGRVIVGQSEAIDLALVTLLAGGGTH